MEVLRRLGTSSAGSKAFAAATVSTKNCAFSTARTNICCKIYRINTEEIIGTIIVSLLWSSGSRSSRGQPGQAYILTIEEAHEYEKVVTYIILISYVHVCVLFDFSASHCFPI